MALQSSGLIRLAGNTTGRSVAKELNLGTAGVHTPTISLGQANVRALAQRTGSVSVGLGHLRGKSNALDTQTVTVGYSAPAQYVPGGYGVFEGGIFSNTPPKVAGSISDGTTNVKNGFRITALRWDPVTGSVGTLYWTILCGTSVVANNGFSTMTVNGNNFARSAANFMLLNSAATTGIAQWNWSNVSNPFGTTIGASRTGTWS